MWRGNKRILFQVFSIQKITNMPSLNHNLSLYTKLMTVLNPISAGGGGGGIHPPPGFSLAIATKINRSTPNFLTFNFYYRDII